MAGVRGVRILQPGSFDRLYGHDLTLRMMVGFGGFRGVRTPRARLQNLSLLCDSL